MAQQNLDFGLPATDDGEFLETAMPKVQANFDDLYLHYGGSKIKGFRDVSGTTDTLLADDRGKVVRYSNVGDITVTVDENVHAEKDVITLLPQGAGRLIVTEGTNFVIKYPDNDSANNKSPGINKPIQLLFEGVADATLIGTTS